MAEPESISAEAISLERIVPDQIGAESGATGSQTLKLHLERYEFAATHARGGRLLDIACGVGYGSNLVSSKRGDILEVIGVDLSPQAVQYANQRYGNERVRFIQHDAMTFRDSQPFDTIISLETLEHLPDPWALAKSLAGQVRAGGVLICSVPVTPSVDANPHHLHDFTPRSFRKMFEGLGLNRIAEFEQVQSYSFFKVVNRTEQRMQDMRKNVAGYYLTHPMSAIKRAASVLIDGFNNKYLTLAWQRSA